MKKRTSKRLLIVLTITIMLTSFAGCLRIPNTKTEPVDETLQTETTSSTCGSSAEPYETDYSAPMGTISPTDDFNIHTPFETEIPTSTSEHPTVCPSFQTENRYYIAEHDHLLHATFRQLHQAPEFLPVSLKTST